MYREMGASEEDVSIAAESVEGIVYIALRILPSIVVVATLFLVWTNLLLARFLFQSRQLFYPDFGRLNQWKAPEPLVWAVIASGILLLVGDSGITLIGINSLIILIYFFQGIAIVSFYLEKKQFPRLLRIMLYGLIAMQQLLLLLVIAVGFFDTWIDFRRERKVEN